MTVGALSCWKRGQSICVLLLVLYGVGCLGCAPSAVVERPTDPPKQPDVPRISDERPVSGMSNTELIESLGHESQNKQRQAELALLEQGAEVVAELIEALAHENWHVRAGAIRTLGLIGNEAHEALPRMKELAEEDPREAVRDAAKFNIPLVERS